MVIISDQVKQTMNHDAVQFFLELRSIQDGVLADRIDADEEIARKDVPFAVVEGDDVREIVVLEITHVHVKDVVVRTENDGQVSDPPDLAFGDHPEPAVVERLTLECERNILVVIAYHGSKFVQIYNY